MEQKIPHLTVSYNGPISDATRWLAFQHRPGDIFICAPPKAGTTWTQAICAMLIFGKPELPAPLSKISPWLDAKFTTLDSTTRLLEDQTLRRVIKTHTPLDGIPYFGDADYIVVYRDPRDAFLSTMMLAFDTADRKTRARMPSDIHAAFRMWLQTPFYSGIGEQLSLASFVHHFRQFWRFRHLSNLHLVHYSDLLVDLPGSIRSVASVLGVPADDNLVGEIEKATALANMRLNAARYAPESGGAWKSPQHFFRNGGSGQWRNILTPLEMADYRARLHNELARDAIDWLEHGSACVGTPAA
jgi:aryl sulfotransferase